ncbi:hypothetical protein Tco_0940908 [Tanacetum coccineum]|uniref:Uncharacterized protein n=1 Tax=Tanacetum coccineum TaxID=301880 RepID=A0ABQ5DR09_9ASTR
MELVNKHLASEGIEKMVDEPENVINDSLISRNDDQNIPDTRLEPRSDKESLEVEITNVVIPVNVNEEEEEITDEVYELKRKEKGKIVEESRSTPSLTPIRSPRIHTDLVSSDTEKLQELTGCYGYLFEHLRAKFLSRKSFDTLDDHLQEVMVESLPTMVDKHIKEQVEKQVSEQERGRLQDEISSQIQQAIDNNIPSLVDASMKFETLQVPQTTCRTSVVRPRDQDMYHSVMSVDPPEGENSNQEQVDDYDFWTESYASDDDETPTKQVSQDIMEEVSLTINEAELKKIVDEMLRQRFQSCQRDPEAPALSLINQDLLYLKKGNSGPEKIVLSLHKFPAIIFNDVDIEERTSRWNPHAKIFYIKRQKEPGKPKEVVYSNLKIIQVIKTYWELGQEHKFITEIVARRANEWIVSITESDYKNLNKNVIEDMYLLIMNGKTSKKEKRVMRHSEIHKFYDATLNRVLEGLKSYNNDVKYGYIQRDLTEDEVEYLKLFKEEIEVRLKYSLFR